MRKEVSASLANELFHNEEEGLYHTSYKEEKAILNCVREGDVDKLEKTYRELPEVVYGKMTSSGDRVKLLFYALIANTTLVTRYAIEGGLDEETAFSLSDVYIRRMELCKTPEELNALNEEMALDFTNRVSLARQKAHSYSKPVTLAIDIIYHGRNKDSSLESISKAVGLTPKYFSKLFHKETGETLSSFTQKVRIEEAKNMLTYSDYSLSDISQYLNFSSQSHFTSVFKKTTGYTPKEFRNNLGKENW